MAKETQKDKISRLEEESKTYIAKINEYKSLIQKLNDEITNMIDNKDTEFESSGTYKQMERRIKFLEVENKSLKDSLEHEKKVRNLINENKYNERGAGRKSKFTDGEKELIKMYRIQGKTIKEIAEMYECSVGLVHKLISK